MTDYIEHKGVSRKTFLIYLLQLPLFGGIAKYLYGFKPQQLYLLNKFSVAGFYFYKGTELVNSMKKGDLSDSFKKIMGSTLTEVDEEH